jgi:hypothetical protein
VSIQLSGVEEWKTKGDDRIQHQKGLDSQGPLHGSEVPTVECNKIQDLERIEQRLKQQLSNMTPTNVLKDLINSMRSTKY